MKIHILNIIFSENQLWVNDIYITDENLKWYEKMKGFHYLFT